MYPRRQAAIVGIAQLPFSKNIGMSEQRAAVLVIREALADAGITPDEVDGLVRYTWEETTEVEVARNLGIPNLRHYEAIDYGGGAGCATIGHAALAIATGAANVVVAWRARNRGSGPRPWVTGPMEVPGQAQFEVPFGLVRPVDLVALQTRLVMEATGLSSEDLGRVAVVIRGHAVNNPAALMRKPMALDDHQASRMIADPLRLFDCCLETDGALAAVLVSADRAADCPHPPAYVVGAAQGTGPEPHVMAFYYGATRTTTPGKYVADALWANTGLTAGDIQVAQIYDAFSPLVAISLEEYGFCPPGEAAKFIAEEGLSVDGGRLPVNTSGGSLSEAYVHGFNLISEGVRQIRGTSHNQVAGVEHVLVTSGSGVPTSAVVLGAAAG